MGRNALDLATGALDKWVDLHGDESLDQQCQRFDGYYMQWEYQGNENIIEYPSATAAGNAASFYSYSINDPAIKPGHLIYWHWGSEGHVGTVMGRHEGRTLVSHTSSKGDTVLALSNHVKISHADTIGLTFRGVSRTDGRNAERVGIAAWDGVTPAVDYAWGLTTAAQRDLQRALTKLKRYRGPIDGIFGENSVRAMQEELRDGQGLLPKSYDADGIPGINYGTALQVLAQAYGYDGPLDGKPGENTSAKLSIWAGVVLGETTTPPTTPPPPVTPKPWEKTYPGASVVVPSPNREPRKQPAVIRYVILHGTANLADHTAFFSRANERQVAPNHYFRPSGECKEFVRLGERAWTTAVPLDHQAATVEIESDNKTFTDAQYEALAQYCAWLSKQTVVDGVDVEFKLDRQFILGHKEVPGVTSNTSCPGALDIDRIVKRAKEIVKPPVETIEVPKAVWESWQSRAAELKTAIEKVTA